MPVVRADQKRRIERTAESIHGGIRSTNNNNTALIHELAAATTLPAGASSVTKRYEKLSRIGRGSYGTVYKARDTQTGSIVALKRCVVWRTKLPRGTRATTSRTGSAPTTRSTEKEDDDVSVIFLREIETLRLCTACPYTVSLLDVIVSSSSLYLVLDYVEHDLAQLIDAHYPTHRKSPFTEEACKTLLMQLLSALSFLHDECSLMHRDVKLSNLLYSSRQGRLLVADFGLSRRYDSPFHDDDDDDTNSNSNSSNRDPSRFQQQQLTPKVVSLWYRPPEVLLGFRSSSSLPNYHHSNCHSNYTPVVDVWSAGCVWIELLTGQPAMAGTSEVNQIARLLDEIGAPEPQADFPLLGTVTLPPTTGAQATPRRRKYRILDRVPFLTDAGSQLVVSMLQLNPIHRWTARQALRSPYFTDHPLPLSERQMPRFASSTG